MSTIAQSSETPAWYAISPEDVAARLTVDTDQGLSDDDAAQRLAEYGPNQLKTEPPPSIWAVGLGQLSNPMNIMLVIVAVASIAIGQVATGIFVALLVTFNVVMGSRQELKARASVDALAQLQVPHARVRRSGRVEEVESIDLVPGDIALLEAGDVVPADGRVIASATLEVQEAALTGESAPVSKDAGTLPEGDVALGDRTNMVFQNTQVTRGTTTFVVTDDRSSDTDGSHRRHGDRDQAGQVAVAARARRLDEDLRSAGVDRRRGDRHHWHRARPGHRDADSALHLHRHLRDPGRSADVRADDVVVGRAAPGRRQGGGEVAHRCRDARRYDGH